MKSVEERIRERAEELNRVWLKSIGEPLSAGDLERLDSIISALGLACRAEALEEVIAHFTEMGCQCGTSLWDEKDSHDALCPESLIEWCRSLGATKREGEGK
jgi:hypothetical protein